MSESSIKLNSEQKEAFKAIRKFLEHPAADTFVLKGYAGTGKTFLMQHLAKWLEQHEHKFSMLASTGRAAAVLRGKTGFDARTVHGELYRFNRVEGDDDTIPEDAPIENYGQMTLRFDLRQPDEEKRIYIVDEASMLSSELSVGGEVTFFGSGVLLIDFFEAVGKNKIIFVGDPGQLPPVQQLYSPALDLNWLAENNRVAITTTLEKIERTAASNDILVLATMIRNLHSSTAYTKFTKLPARNFQHVQLHASMQDLYNSYVEKFKQHGTNGVIAVARSNKLVDQINRAFRRDVYGDPNLPIQPKEILMVVQNNYAVPLTNGDFVEVVSVGEIVLQANLRFQSIRVKALASEREYELLISIDVLQSKDGNFTRHQSKALMVDFSRRMKSKRIQPNSEKYKEEMMKDGFLNCLKAKFGYAVTCHKAQGGEWDEVYLFLDKGMYIMEPPGLFRWWYTAVTRARKKLHIHDEWWIA